MMSNNLKYILREFNRQKSYVFINFVGLTIGLATALLIGKYVLNEWKADVFIPHPERTFRLLRISEINHEPYRIGVTSAPFATAIQQDYPDDIETTCRVLNGNSLVTIGDKNFEEAKYGYVDPNFVTFFNLPLLHGDPNTVLSEEHRIILSKKTAEKYFGTTAAAFGKTLKIDNDYDAIVSGVFDDPTW
jgi:putative ABC transport system permease protein